jgi:hypothetical protein
MLGPGPAPSVFEPTGDFCSKGGRFGRHGSNEQVTERFHKKLVAISYFNAGVRMLDIRQPFWLQEVVHYVPRPDQNTFYCDEGCASVNQTNNVEMDDRGYVYIVDRAGTGMHVLELTVTHGRSFSPSTIMEITVTVTGECGSTIDGRSREPS